MTIIDIVLSSLERMKEAGITTFSKNRLLRDMSNLGFKVSRKQLDNALQSWKAKQKASFYAGMWHIDEKMGDDIKPDKTVPVLIKDNPLVDLGELKEEIRVLKNKVSVLTGERDSAQSEARNLVETLQECRDRLLLKDAQIEAIKIAVFDKVILGEVSVV